MFTLNLLAIIQQLIFSISVLQLVFSCINLLSRTNKLVSFANIQGLVIDEALAISLIYNKKSKGPRTLPCGTPHYTISDKLELTLPTHVYCFLFDK